MDKVDTLRQKLDYMARFKSAAWALFSLLSAVVLIMYGLVFTTNLLSQLNPLNTLINIVIALLCYAIMAVGFYFLWQKFSQLLNQVISGFKN